MEIKKFLFKTSTNPISDNYYNFNLFKKKAIEGVDSQIFKAELKATIRENGYIFDTIISQTFKFAGDADKKDIINGILNVLDDSNFKLIKDFCVLNQIEIKDSILHISFDRNSITEKFFNAEWIQ